jgi:hypothetical protein
MDFDFSKPPKQLLRTQENERELPTGYIKYARLHPDRKVRFKLYYHLQALGHIKLSTRTQQDDTAVTHISRELADAINSESQVLQAYMKLVL